VAAAGVSGEAADVTNLQWWFICDAVETALSALVRPENDLDKEMSGTGSDDEVMLQAQFQYLVKALKMLEMDDTQYDEHALMQVISGLATDGRLHRVVTAGLSVFDNTAQQGQTT
jgi:hypothetical protein